jgi:hypothetical protein
VVTALVAAGALCARRVQQQGPGARFRAGGSDAGVDRLAA